MYHHLLVPVDDTALSAANVSASIDLAKLLSARITFFHALKDWAATGDGSLLRTVDPERFGEAALGDSNSILAKALASARAALIQCQGVSRVCDRPADAIVDAVAQLQCDLIVMSSRGGRGALGGWLHNSQTERVLRRAPVALLVTRVATAAPLKASDGALGHIQDEHRSIAVVIQAMCEIVKDLRAGGAATDLHVLENLVHYLKQFPLRVHHPKEELHLHKWLRVRDPEWSDLLAEVEAQHVREGELVDAVQYAMERYQSGHTEELQAAIETLAKAIYDHMNMEELRVLPHAQIVLQESDWVEIAEAFALNDDPRYGDLAADEFRSLFTKIANQLRTPERASPRAGA